MDISVLSQHMDCPIPLSELPRVGEVSFGRDDTASPASQVFIEVRSSTDNKISGIIASDVPRPATDWLISKPDGTEEGDVVGILLDPYKP